MVKVLILTLRANKEKVNGKKARELDGLMVIMIKKMTETILKFYCLI